MLKIELVKEKSVEHRRLEEALQQNKERVLALVSEKLGGSALVQRLREEAKNLTILLTNEIQREVATEARRDPSDKASLVLNRTSTWRGSSMNQSSPRVEYRLMINGDNNGASGNHLKNIACWVFVLLPVLVIFLCGRRSSRKSYFPHFNRATKHSWSSQDVNGTTRVQR